MRQPLTSDEHTLASARLVRIEGETRDLLQLLSDRPEVRVKILDRLLKVREVVDQVRFNLSEISTGASQIYFPNPTRCESEVRQS